VGMGLVVKIDQGAGSDEAFASTIAAGEEERDVGDLFGKDGGGAIDPGDLFVGANHGQVVLVGRAIVATEPGCRREGFLIGRRCGSGTGDVEAEDFHETKWNWLTTDGHGFTRIG
jgi:hypothetical protein